MRSAVLLSILLTTVVAALAATADGPVPSGSAPGSPAPSDPAPGSPVPGNPAPSNPAPGSPVPGNPAPSNPAPSGMVPGSPAPSNPAPSGTVPGSPAPDRGPSGSASSAVREPAMAGRFYPDDPAALRAAVTAFLGTAVAPRGGKPVALVAPHAGYIYSGQIAADAWRQAAGLNVEIVVLLGTNHTVPPFVGAAVSPSSGFRTPLGVAPVDTALAAALVAAEPLFRLDARPHEREHSVEVQVPFMQVVLPGTKLLPIVVGDPDPDLCVRMGRALAAALRGRRALLVASSDLSHYPTYDDALAADRATLAAIAGMDPGALHGAVARELRGGRAGLATCACGEAPILVAQAAARASGAGRGIVLSYANSGDTALPDRDRVVGYGAVAFVGGPGAAETDVPMDGRAPAAPAGADAPLGRDDRRALLALARGTIERYLVTQTAPLVRGGSPVLGRPQGAFVTLKKHGELRGCIGHTAADMPLGQTVAAMALQAAFNDRRFPPLEARELGEIDIEVSLLGPLRPAAGPEAVVPGRDGVVIRKDGRSALFLPEVATEQKWSRDQLLTHLSEKAGLPPDAWRSGAELLVFHTVAIYEKEPAGIHEQEPLATREKEPSARP